MIDCSQTVFRNAAATRSREILAVIVILLAVALVGCSKKEAEAEPVVSVQVQSVKRAAIAQIISTDAVIYPVEQAVMAPKITSTIKNFAVERGSRVRKGELLAVLENADLTAAVDQSKGEFQQAEASYASTTGASLPQELQKATLDAGAAKIALDAQQKVYDSRKSLFDQGAVPRRDLDAAEVGLTQARGQYEVAQRQLDDLKKIGQAESLKAATGQLGAAKGKYAGAEAQLSYSELRSPIDGVVTDRPLFPGELATANQPVLTVMNISKLIAKAHISQAESAALHVGDAAEIEMDADGAPVKSRVSLISPAVDSGSSTVEVWFEVSKPPAELRPGISVRVNATAQSHGDALVVPLTALFKNSDGAPYVLIAQDNHARQQLVKTGIRSADAVEIIGGVKEGDSVITAGGYGVPDKTAVSIEAPPPTDTAAPDDGDGGTTGKAATSGKDDDPKTGTKAGSDEASPEKHKE